MRKLLLFLILASACAFGQAGTPTTFGDWYFLNEAADIHSSDLGCYSPTQVTTGYHNLQIVMKSAGAPFACGGNNGSNFSTNQNYLSGSAMWHDLNFKPTVGHPITIDIVGKFGVGWGAFWLLGGNKAGNTGCQTTAPQSWDNFSTCNWNLDSSDSAEIDIAETASWSDTTTVGTALHSNNTDTNCALSTSDYTSNFHKYHIDWSTTTIHINIDGGPNCTFSSNVPQNPMFLILEDRQSASNTVAGLPTTTTVQYVQVCDGTTCTVPDNVGGNTLKLDDFGVAPVFTTANLWVDTNGGTCTRSGSLVAWNDATACASMQAALTASAAGDTIVIKNGNYANQTLSTSGKASVVSFYAETPSSCYNQPAKAATCTGSVTLGAGNATGSANQTALSIQVNHVHINGVVANGSGEGRGGLATACSTCTDVIVNGFAGKDFFAQSSGTTISNSEFGNFNVCTGYTLNVGCSANSNCAIEDVARFWGDPAPQNDTLLDSSIHDLQAPPDGVCGGTNPVPHADLMQVFQSTGSATNITIDGNLFYNGNGDDNIQWGGGGLSNIIIQNNYFGDTACCNGIAFGQASPCTLSFRNNVINWSASKFLINDAQCAGPINISNNIDIQGSSVATTGTATITGGNNIFPPAGGTTIGGSPKRCTPTWFNGVPSAANGYDIRLNSLDSCATNAGSGASFAPTDFYSTIRPQGATPDVGAFEVLSAGGAVAPTVTTTTATSITTTTASSGGTVTSNGGASVTSEGVCFATTVNPTSPCTSDGTVTPFTSALSGLSVNTLYHYRAFAANSAGTGFGSDLTFTTANTSFTISGTISTAAGSTNPNPFSVSCPACSPTTATTTAGGAYSFANQAGGGNYVITPSIATYTFAPASATFNNLAANQAANFTATGTATASLQIPAAFANQGVGITSSPRTPSLSNTGTGQLSGISVSIVGTNPGDFSISNNACGATLSAASSCIISVTFTPTAVGLRQATLQTVDSVGTQTAPLSGTGFQPPVPSCTPTGGIFKSGRMISCSNVVPLATMCFQMNSPPTTNGAGTCTSGTTYIAPFMVTSTGTLFVTGTQSGNTDNSVSYPFTITNGPWTTGWVMNLPGGGTTTFGPVSLAGSCGPPTYACVSRSTASLGTITSSVDSTTPFNTTWHSAINPNTDCYTLLADSNLTGIARNTSSNQTLTLIAGGNNTWSLGANDHMGSKNNTFWGIGRNGGAYIYHFTMSNVGGSTCVQNISPFGGQGAGLWLGGSVTFSTTTDNIAYHIPNGTGNHILTKEVLNSDASNSTSSTTFDFDTCPGMTPGTNYQATTQLGIAVGDTRFATALSPGNQGFGKDILVYEPGVGCHHWDTATGDIWLPTDTSSASLHETACFTPDYATGSGIHGTQIGGNGKVVQISGACWVGFGGVAIGGSNVAYWEVGTANVIGIKDQPPSDFLSTNTALNRGTFNIAGHDSMSAFHTMVGHNPTPNSRVVFPFSEANMRNFTTLFDFGGGPDSHGGHPLLDLADTYPWIWGSMGTLGTIYNQEVYGLGPNPGSPIRFGPLYNTGTNGGPGCGDSILAISQDGKMIVFMTDMLGTIPTCAPVAMVLGN
jgi:hypothetical protein